MPMITHRVTLLFCCLAFSFTSSARPEVVESYHTDGSPMPDLDSRSACLGDGYIPYGYPAFETCPCGNDGCFHPWRYYAGGKCYRRNWFHTWLRAHLGLGSMLEDYPCPCIFPIHAAPTAIPVEPEASTVWPVAPVPIESSPAER